MRRLAFVIRTGCALAAALLVAGAAHAQPFVVFAAASLKNALDEVSLLSRSKPALSYGASSTLARQIENGAPAQVFISADLEWMDYLERKNLLRAGTRRNIVGNRLALVAPAASTVELEIRPGFPLARALGGGGLAMADPQLVPAGKYARAALETLGAWNSVSGKIAPAENVRAALALVARGEAPLGAVYASDAVAEPKVRIVAMFPADSHPAIVYPAALSSIASPAGPGADFLSLLESPAARKVFEKHGFAPLN